MSKLSKIEREKRTVEQMVRVYCRRKEGNREFCSSCRELIEYAHYRLSLCPFGEDKTSCRKCKVHCYKTDMRQRIRDVMRYSGPRMIFYNPIAAIKHLVSEL